MTLKSRLALGLLNIAVLLLIPLSIALTSLDRLHRTTQGLRSREFAASLLLGRLRGRMDDLRADEMIFGVTRSDTARVQMQERLATLRATSDSLSGYFADTTTRRIREAVSQVERATALEIAAAVSAHPDRADTVSDLTLRPAIDYVQRSIVAAEQALSTRIAGRVDEATAATENAWQLAGTTLACAVVLATLIAAWLTSTVSRPIRDLETGMKKVANGEFGHQLTVAPNRRDEFGRLAASYQSMARQLAELDKLKAEFVSIASHELKTPLNVIIGYLQLLEEGLYGDVTPKQREVLETIEAQCEALTRLVKQLLDVSRFEAGGGKLEPRRVSLPLFLRELHSAFQVLALQRGISFVVSRGPGLPETVFWDEDRINEVLGNLLSNAFKFTDRGGRVELAVAVVPEGVRMEVRDSGAGIAPHQLPHVFEKFYQADNQSAASAKGTGLGLAIAKEIVEAHQGSIAVSSEVGVGTAFTITLPVEAPASWRRTPRRSVPVAVAR
jgi:signal transduction histidine kinase